MSKKLKLQRRSPSCRCPSPHSRLIRSAGLCRQLSNHTHATCFITHSGWPEEHIKPQISLQWGVTLSANLFIPSFFHPHCPAVFYRSVTAGVCAKSLEVSTLTIEHYLEENDRVIIMVKQACWMLILLTIANECTQLIFSK